MKQIILVTIFIACCFCSGGCQKGNGEFCGTDDFEILENNENVCRILLYKEIGENNGGNSTTEITIEPDRLRDVLTVENGWKIKIYCCAVRDNIVKRLHIARYPMLLINSGLKDGLIFGNDGEAYYYRYTGSATFAEIRGEEDGFFWHLPYSVTGSGKLQLGSCEKRLIEVTNSKIIMDCCPIEWAWPANPGDEISDIVPIVRTLHDRSHFYRIVLTKR